MKPTVPPGMLKAAMNAIEPSVLMGTQTIALEAALSWLDAELDKLTPDGITRETPAGYLKAIQDVRRIFAEKP